VSIAARDVRRDAPPRPSPAGSSLPWRRSPERL